MSTLTWDQGESSLKYAKCLEERQTRSEQNSVADSVSGILYKEHEQTGNVVSQKPRNSIKAPPARVSRPSLV